MSSPICARSPIPRYHCLIRTQRPQHRQQIKISESRVVLTRPSSARGDGTQKSDNKKSGPGPLFRIRSFRNVPPSRIPPVHPWSGCCVVGKGFMPFAHRPWIGSSHAGSLEQHLQRKSDSHMTLRASEPLSDVNPLPNFAKFDKTGYRL
jgi:hypothetical protein